MAFTLDRSRLKSHFSICVPTLLYVVQATGEVVLLSDPAGYFSLHKRKGKLPAGALVSLGPPEGTPVVAFVTGPGLGW